MIRPLLLEVLGHAVHARMSMESLKAAILDELRAGYRPTTRGYEWNRDQFIDIEAAGLAIQVAFDLLKAVQFPETRASRLADALESWEQLYRSYDDGGDGGYRPAELGPGDEPGHLNHEGGDLAVLNVELGLDAGKPPV